MEDIKRRLNIQTLKSQLLLNDLERSALRRELASPLISVERRNAIHARIPTLIRQRMRTESKLQWFEAVERLHPAESSQAHPRQFGTHLSHADSSVR